MKNNQRNTKFPFYSFFVLLALLLTSGAQAEQVDKAVQVAQSADKAIRGYGDFTASLEMVLTNKKGESATRTMRVKNFEADADIEKSMILFETPKDLQGTGLLSYGKRTGTDEQWLYLPTVARVKQIAAKNKSGPFMGGEFAFEDLGSQYWEKYTYRYLREEQLDGLDCDVIERDPIDADSGYSREEVWIDKQHHLVRKTLFYDRKGTLLKTYTSSGFQQHNGFFWRPTEMLMVNQQTGKSTKLVWTNYQIKTGLTDADFSQNSLMRAK